MCKSNVFFQGPGRFFRYETLSQISEEESNTSTSTLKVEALAIRRIYTSCLGEIDEGAGRKILFIEASLLTYFIEQISNKGLYE